jgi:hypothetical protein
MKNAIPVLLKNSARSRPQGRNADYSSSERFLTCDTLATMSVTYYQVDSFANEPFDLPLAMAKRELL